jgi:hypothetical protein
MAIGTEVRGFNPRRKAKFISFARLSFSLLDESAGRIGRELWWTNQDFSSVDVTPLLFSMFICHPRVKQ